METWEEVIRRTLDYHFVMDLIAEFEDFMYDFGEWEFTGDFHLCLMALESMKKSLENTGSLSSEDLNRWRIEVVPVFEKLDHIHELVKEHGMN